MKFNRRYQGIGLEDRKLTKLWKEERIFFYPLLWLTCGLFVILRGNINHLLEVEWLDLDIIPIFLIYLVAQDQQFEASCLAFFMGILTDIFAPCPLGLFAFAYSVILLGIYLCRRLLDLNNIRTSILMVASVLMAKWIFLLLIMRYFPARQSIAWIPFVLVSVSIVITSLITPFLFYSLNLLRGKEDQNRD